MQFQIDSQGRTHQEDGIEENKGLRHRFLGIEREEWGSGLCEICKAGVCLAHLKNSQKVSGVEWSE